MYIAPGWHDDRIMELEGERKLSLSVSFHCSGINPKRLTETTKILRIVTAPAEIRMGPFPNTGETYCCSSRLAGKVIRCEICKSTRKTESGFKLQTLYTFNSSF